MSTLEGKQHDKMPATIATGRDAARKIKKKGRHGRGRICGERAMADIPGQID
jgi:hypothetical protein